MGIGDEKYVLLTTHRQDGSSASTPVWIAGMASGEVGFRTQRESFKARRIEHDSRVELAPCDTRGEVRPGAATCSGDARVVEGAEFQAVARAIEQKYGWQARAIRWMHRAKRTSGSDIGIVVTLDR